MIIKWVITIIPEKSPRTFTEGGLTLLIDTYWYAEPVTCRVLVFIDSPGYDPMSITGQVADGADIIAFTTIRGGGLWLQAGTLS